MQGDNRTRSRSRQTAILRWSERLFVIAGIVILGWCGLVLADSELAQWQARRSLETVSLAASVAPPRMTDPAFSRPASAPTLRPGSAIGTLSIPRIALGAIVLHGSDTRTLRHGPGHVESTALPGEAGNAVIAGHRDSFFRGLGEVIVGDDVFVDTPREHLHYRVTSTRVVNAHDLSVLEQNEDAVLTLITCYPFWILGPAPDRFVVRAALVENTAFETRSVPPPSAYEPSAAQTASVVQAREAGVTIAPFTRDETILVRQAIERFRVTYNARLVSHHDVRPGGALEFQSCDVARSDNQATATCAIGSPSGPGGDNGAWTIKLERSDRGWAIKTIVGD